MADIFETTVICDECNTKTEKRELHRGGFSIRVWRCVPCNKQWEHPGDIEEYKKFRTLKNKQFQVKLRYVGNSYAISIPREIIDFQEHSMREINQILNLALESPEKLSIYFSKKINDLMEE